MITLPGSAEARAAFTRERAVRRTAGTFRWASAPTLSDSRKTKSPPKRVPIARSAFIQNDSRTPNEMANGSQNIGC